MWITPLRIVDSSGHMRHRAGFVCVPGLTEKITAGQIRIGLRVGDFFLAIVTALLEPARRRRCVIARPKVDVAARPDWLRGRRGVLRNDAIGTIEFLDPLAPISPGTSQGEH